MAVVERTMTLVWALVSGVAGAVLFPVAWGAISGAIAGFLAGAGWAVPAFLTVGVAVQSLPWLVVVGFVAGVWWSMKQ